MISGLLLYTKASDFKLLISATSCVRSSLRSLLYWQKLFICYLITLFSSILLILLECSDIFFLSCFKLFTVFTKRNEKGREIWLTLSVLWQFLWTIVTINENYTSVTNRKAKYATWTWCICDDFLIDLSKRKQS